MKDYTRIKADIGKITTLTLCGNTELNILNIETISELSEQLNELKSNDEIRVLLITGQGNKAFCSGADIKELGDMDELYIEEYIKKGTDTYKQIEDFPTPVIAVINGFAFGAGFELAIACDMRFMAEETKISQPAVKHGLIPPFGGLHRLPQIIGSGRAREVIFGAMDLSSHDCMKLGLVNRVYPRNILMDEVLKFAESICKNKKYAIAMAKDSINNYFNYNTSYSSIEDENLARCLKNEFTKQQLLSFFEKKRG